MDEINNSVILETIDGHIWHIENTILDIVSKLINQKAITIDLNGEGPCAKSVGLYDILDNIVEKFDINPKLITIITSNFLESNNKYTIKRKSLGHRMLLVAKTQFESYKKIDNDFKHFGIFIGRSNWIRLRLCSHIYNNYKNKCLMSYHFNHDIKDNNCGLDESVFYYSANYVAENYMPLLSTYPHFLDDLPITYPINYPANTDLLSRYNQIFLDVVAETFFTGNTFAVSEKITRPLLAKTPFIVAGSANFLFNLKKLGFETFSNFWSEEYDKYEGVYRIQLIEELLQKLSYLTVGDMSAMLKNMEPILEHNVNNLKSLTSEKINKAFNNE